VQGAVVISGIVGQRWCSHCGLRYLSHWQRVRQWKRRGPHAERPESVVAPSADLGVFAEVTLDLRVRRSCVCNLRVIVSWWRSSGDCSGLQRVAASP
jgi:hypothetical protein